MRCAPISPPLPPVELRKPANKLPFPFNIRFLLRIWNALFFHPGEFRPDPAKTQEWNRGAYLVWGPGHCGGCHTPKNFLGADRNKHALQGGRLDNWVAVNLTGEPRQGLAAWSREEVAEYLRSGRNARTAASGAMQEVVYYSTSRMSDADLLAMATYLKDLAPKAPKPGGKPPSAAAMRAGEAIFADACAACHRANGEGVPRFFPPLAGDAALQAKDPTTIVRIILAGTRSLPTPAAPTPLAMPAFAWKLDDAQIASVATFVRNSWGNSAPAGLAAKVAKLRRKYGRDRRARGPRRRADAHGKMVGERGFEPPAPASRRQCSTRLSYSPTGCPAQGRPGDRWRSISEGARGAQAPGSGVRGQPHSFRHPRESGDPLLRPVGVAQAGFPAFAGMTKEICFVPRGLPPQRRDHLGDGGEFLAGAAVAGAAVLGGFDRLPVAEGDRLRRRGAASSASSPAPPALPPPLPGGQVRGDLLGDLEAVGPVGADRPGRPAPRPADAIEPVRDHARRHWRSGRGRVVVGHARRSAGSDSRCS